MRADGAVGVSRRGQEVQVRVRRVVRGRWPRRGVGQVDSDVGSFGEREIGRKSSELNDEKLFKPFYRVNYFGVFWDVTLMC